MCEQLSLLPLVHQFSKEGVIRYSNYWEAEECKDSDFYLVFNKESYCLLLPYDKTDWLSEVVWADKVVITKGAYNGEPYFEIMFQDNIEKPVCKMLPDRYFERVTPPKEGWHGRLFVYKGFLGNMCETFDKVYYRVADTLPFCKPVEEK